MQLRKMAKNPYESQKSVAEEEDYSTDNGGTESDSESEQPQTQMHVSQRPSMAETKLDEPSTQSKSNPASSSSYETDSDSGPDPITRPTGPPQQSGQIKSPRKRPAPEADSEIAGSKLEKQNPKFVIENSENKPSVADESKKQLFQRLWSEDDEIALLQGMIEYTEKHNADPITDLDAFHDFIRKSLHFVVSKNQLQNKIKRMRKKYMNNAGKGKKGKEKSFSKPHEQKSYELSKKVWGKVSGNEKFKDRSSEVRVVHALMACNGSAMKGKSKSPIKKALMFQDVIKTPKVNAAASSGVKDTVNGENCRGFNSLLGSLEKNKDIVISGEKRNEIQKKRKAVVVAEIELFLEELELIQEQVKGTLEAMK